METIIAILVAVFILIFKVIEKKMNSSAQPRPAQPALDEIFPAFEQEEDVRPSVKVTEKPIDEPVAQKIDVKEESPEKKEKIDPKKLVVYSEIMNRKY